MKERTREEAAEGRAQLVRVVRRRGKRHKQRHIVRATAVGAERGAHGRRRLLGSVGGIPEA